MTSFLNIKTVEQWFFSDKRNNSKKITWVIDSRSVIIETNYRNDKLPTELFVTPCQATLIVFLLSNSKNRQQLFYYSKILKNYL